MPRALLVLIALSAAVACGGGERTAPAAASAPAFANHDPSVQYVGMDACKDCHLGVYSTYKNTGMARAFYPLTPDIVVEDFHDNNTVEIDGTGVHYRVFERDGRYYQRQYVLDSQGREMAAEERELVIVVGSNNHSRSYLTQIDGKLFQAPVCWYPQAEKWDLCPGFEFKNEHFGREISTSCLGCHNGRMELVPGERNLFEEPYPHGIGCERCHGPGQLHVERWRGAEGEGTGEPDPTIVNPRRLARRERVEICFQCHLGDARATTRVGVYGRDEQDFRPGMPWRDFVVPFHYVEQTQWDFGLSSQADRMVLSRCYTASEGKLECLTCHNPHLSVYSEDRPTDYFRKKCLGCHQMSDCGAPMEARGKTSPADDCVACHMRRAEPDDQRYTEFTDHWIRKNIDLEERDHRRDFTVQPIFPEDLARFSEGEQLYYRGRGSFLLATDAPRSRYAEMWAEAERQFRAAIEAGFDNESSWFFLGKTLSYQGRTPEALEAFERAVAHDPKHHDAQFALGGALVALGDFSRAAEVYRRMLEQDGGNVMALSEYGRTLFMMGLREPALEAFRRAVREEPWEPTVQKNLGMALAALGRMDDAAAAGDRAVRLDPESADAWVLYFNAMREAGRLDESREGERHARRLQEQPPPLGH